MADPNSNGSSSSSTVTPPDAGPASRRRSPLPLAILAALFIIVPFLTWYGTWYGRKLSDDDTGKYLTEGDNPRHLQHALVQVAERLDHKDGSVRQWYPQLLKLAASPLTEIRQTVAWVMGKDGKSEEFHAALLGLLGDTEPIVRRNAAVSLSAFGDARGRPELLAMLRPYTVVSTGDGIIGSILTTGSPVRVGALLARLAKDGEGVEEIRSPLPGTIGEMRVNEGARVKIGDPLLVLAPDGESVWEALRGLFITGQPEDLPEVERYAQGVERMPEDIKKQAALTAEAIQRRAQDRENLTAPGPSSPAPGAAR